MNLDESVREILLYLQKHLSGNWKYSLFGGEIKKLIQIAENQPDYFKTALDCLKGNKQIYATSCEHDRYQQQEPFRLVLLMAYFTAKYNNCEQTAVPPDCDSGNTPEIIIAAEDVPPMKQYEDIILSHLGDLFQNKMEEFSLAQIVDAVVKNQITPEIKKLAASVSVDKVWLHLYGGLAYLNYNLSVVLRNIVKICLEMKIDFDVRNRYDNCGMLEVMRYISSLLFMAIERRGIHYDKVLGIDSGRYIRWAAFQRYQAILEQQFLSNRECFLCAMSETDWDWNAIYKVAYSNFIKSEDDLKNELNACNLLYEIVRRQDAPLYYQLLSENRQQNVNRERIIEMFIREAGDDIELLRAYLRGEVPVDRLYPIAEQIQEEYFLDAYTETDCFMEYLELFEDEPFHRRCEVYMMLRRSGHFIVTDVSVSSEDMEDLCPQKVQKLFRNLDKEGFTVARQFAGLMMMQEYWGGNEDWTEALVESAAGCFAEYLHERREETFHAFAAGNAFGRFFALRVMRECAEENKTEILYFSKDTAKKVQKELLAILCEQRGWEKDIRQLLNAKKAAQRELAAKVLLFWQGDGTQYQDSFVQMLKTEKNSKIRALLEESIKKE